MKRLATVLSLCLLTGGFVPVRADAAQLELSFNGNISTIPAQLDGLFAILDTVSGSFVFDTETSDTNPSAEIGEYISTPADVVFHFGSFTWTAPGAGGGDSTLVRNESGQDGVSVNVLQPTGPSTNGYTASNLSFLISDADGSTFPSDAFPLALDEGDFPFAQVRITFQKLGVGSQTVIADVTFTAPEPVAALAALKRKAQRRRSS